MKDLGITKGEWVRDDDWIISGLNNIALVASKAEQDLNLFCDAGNTAQKCGLLPSELLAQRDELLEALKRIELIYYWQDELAGKIAHDAINKITE